MNLLAALTHARRQIEPDLLAVGIAFVVLIYLVPVLILGQDLFVNPNDNLDSELPWRMALTASDSLFSVYGPVEQIMNGIPAAYLVSPLNVYVLLVASFEPFIAYVANDIAVHTLAFFSMWVLLGHPRLRGQETPWIRFGVSLVFALLPFLTTYGLSVAGQPLVLFAFLNLATERPKATDFAILALFPFYSSLPLVGPFIVAAAGLLFLYFSVQQRRILWAYLLGILILCCCYLVAEYKLVYLSKRINHLIL